MKVVFRVDASNEIGTGHVVRCLTLAEELRSLGSECIFICRNHVGNIIARIEKQNFQFHVLSNLSEFRYESSGLDHAHWLGCDWEIDVEQTKGCLESMGPDWLIVDHYALDHRWEKSLSVYCQKLLVIDDLADRKHQCDLLLDQNLFEGMQHRYLEKVSDSCIQLLGPQYALLQPRYKDLHSQVIAKELPIKNILVSFGGIDQHDLTGLTMLALETLEYSFDNVDVVLSRQSPNYKHISEMIDRLPFFTLHSDLPSLAELMMKADLAIGASGSTSWERCCLGLPTLVVTLSDNQRMISKDLNQMGLIDWIGDVETISMEDIKKSVSETLSRNDFKNWSEQCLEVGSGNGTSIVAEEMFHMIENT